MDIRRLLFPAICVLGLLSLAGTASAQCANQGCQRPDPTSSCYSCSDATGYNCNVTSCSSCTESVCPAPNPCDTDPYSDACYCQVYGIPGACACLADPSSDECTCYREGFRACPSAMAQPDRVWQAVKLPDVRHRLLPKEMAGIAGRPANSGCQVLNLPKKLLFSL